MVFILTTLFLIFGLVVGSFLNVVICRMNTTRSLGGRSACMSCRNQLSWYDLIPFFSFIALRGRCRNCQTRIAISYPLVELLAGLIFVALFLKFQDILFISVFQFIISYVYYAFMFSLLLVIAAYDSRHKIIPDALSFIFGVLAFAGLFFFKNNIFLGFYPYFPTGLELLSGILIALPFALFWLVSQGRWMGLGDAKLALGMGWLLGLPLAISAVVLSFWTGATAGLGLIIFSKIYDGHGIYGMKSEIPFAFYLFLGTLFAFIFNLRLLPV